MSKSIPKFTASPMTQHEKEWLGKWVEVKWFNRFEGSHPAKLPARGSVVSLGPFTGTLWVYVEGSGFYVVQPSGIAVEEA